MQTHSLLAVAVAALLATPVAASAQARRGTAPKTAAAQPAAGARALSVAGWLGYEMGDLDGIQLRVDGELPFQKLTPQIALSFVGSLGYSRIGDDAPGVDWTANVLKIVPAARFTLPLSPELSVFGDAGLGLYYSSVTLETESVLGRAEVDDSSLGLMLRLGAGGFYAVNPRTKLGAQLVLDPMFGDSPHSDTTVTLLAGLSFQL
jgi:hypothetical protein